MKKFGLASDQINATLLNQLGFSRSNYTTICNPDRETTFFVEVNTQESHRPQWMNLLILVEALQKDVCQRHGMMS